MTDEEKQRLRELCERATPGPWKPCGANGERCVCGLVWANEHVPLQGDDMESNPTADNAAFIAASRTALPALLALVESLTAERDALYAAKEEAVLHLQAWIDYGIPKEAAYESLAGLVANLREAVRRG